MCRVMPKFCISASKTSTTFYNPPQRLMLHILQSDWIIAGVSTRGDIVHRLASTTLSSPPQCSKFHRCPAPWLLCDLLLLIECSFGGEWPLGVGR